MTVEKPVDAACDLVTDTPVLSLDELCKNSGLPLEKITTYVAEGVITPDGQDMSVWRFSRVSLVDVRRANRLERDLGLNAAGVMLALSLTAEISDLKAKLRRLENLEDD